MKFSFTKKNKMFIYVNGVKGFLGSRFKWKFNTQYNLELKIKTGSYATIRIGSYKQKATAGSPDMGFQDGFSELLPVYASAGTNIADGTFINNLEIKTWMYQPADALEDEYENDESIFSIGAVFGEDTAYSSLMNLKLSYVF